eukprot:5138774-Alexandrium_andersonii.AAC.1
MSSRLLGGPLCIVLILCERPFPPLFRIQRSMHCRRSAMLAPFQPEIVSCRTAFATCFSRSCVSM